MNVFEKRPLALILCIGLGGFFLFTFENTILRVALCCLSFLPAIISLFLKIDNAKKILLRISSAALVISFLLSFLYFDLWFKAYEIYEDEIEIVGTVEESSATNSYTTRLKVKVESIDGRVNRGYTFYAYASKADTAGIIDGTKIRFRATLSGFSSESRTYNFSKGINAYAGDVKDLSIISYSDGSLSEGLAYLKEYLSRYTIMLSDSETGAFLSALLLGERDYLPQQVRLDFKRIGISHILALSGMHLAILSAGLGWVLTRLRVKKKPRLIIICCFILFYMALTGFSVSVVRAGIMLIISSVMFLLSQSKDSFTSLTLAVFIICLISPHSVFDISLQLSAGATMGIIVLSEYWRRLPTPKNMRDKIVRYVSFSLLSSVFAISATIMVSTYTFGGFSVVAPFATLIFSLLVEVIMYLGCLMLLIGWLIPIGALLSPLCSLVSGIAGAVSSFEFVYVSADFPLASVLIAAYSLLFFLLIIAKVKNRKIGVNILTLVFAAVLMVPTMASAVNDARETVAYCSDTKCDEVLIRSRGEVCLINSAQYSQGLAYTTLNLLEETGVTYLDKYLLTHYSWSLDDDLDVLLSNIAVEEIIIPTPQNDDEKTILKILYNAVKHYRTEIITVGIGQTVAVGDYNVNLLYSAPYGVSSTNAFCFSDGETNYTYFSSGIYSLSEIKNLEGYAKMSDCLILGDHGKKYKTKIYLEESYDGLDHLIIHSSNIFLTQESMGKYIEKGCVIEMHPENVVYFKK